MNHTVVPGYSYAVTASEDCTLTAANGWKLELKAGIQQHFTAQFDTFTAPVPITLNVNFNSAPAASSGGGVSEEELDAVRAEVSRVVNSLSTSLVVGDVEPEGAAPQNWPAAFTYTNTTGEPLSVKKLTLITHSSFPYKNVPFNVSVFKFSGGLPVNERNEIASNGEAVQENVVAIRIKQEDGRFLNEWNFEPFEVAAGDAVCFLAIVDGDLGLLGSGFVDGACELQAWFCDSDRSPHPTPASLSFLTGVPIARLEFSKIASALENPEDFLFVKVVAYTEINHTVGGGGEGSATIREEATAGWGIIDPTGPLNDTFNGMIAAAPVDYAITWGHLVNSGLWFYIKRKHLQALRGVWESVSEAMVASGANPLQIIVS